MDRDDFLHKEREKKVYEQHNIDTKDEGYRNFVSPITSAIVADFTQDASGLDFGAGRSAIISSVLHEYEILIKNYDPFFHNDRSLLEGCYDFISSCEVVEHFHNPSQEFILLRDLLKEGGKLYIMTDLYDEREFGRWYYKNDPTHVFFYTAKTFDFIQERFGFQDLRIEGRLVILSL